MDSVIASLITIRHNALDIVYSIGGMFHILYVQ